MNIQFLGHSAFKLSEGSISVLIDPFLSGNPKASTEPDKLEANSILVTHGHGDHLGDTVAIAMRTGASVTAIVELAHEIASHGIQTFDPNLGGTVKFEWGWVKLVPAWHTSVSPGGTVCTPAGMLIDFKGNLIYHLGDTCLFSDLQLVATKDRKIDVALVPIGGHYTMDRRDAVQAVKLIGPKTVIPMHYNTFPLIETDVDAFKAEVKQATETQVAILQPGESFELR